MKFLKSHGGRENYFRVRYRKDLTNDCVVRAISHATNRDYMEVFKDICTLAVKTGYLPNNPETYEAYLENLGWVKRKPMRNENGKLLKVKQIVCDKDLIVSTSGHLTYVTGDNYEMTLMDSWDCRESVAYSYWENMGDYQ